MTGDPVDSAQSPVFDQLQVLESNSLDEQYSALDDEAKYSHFDNEQLGKLIHLLNNPPPPPPLPPPEPISSDDELFSDADVFEDSLKRQEFAYRAEQDGLISSEDENESINVNLSYHHPNSRPVMWKGLTSTMRESSSKVIGTDKEMICRKLRKDTLIHFRQSDLDHDGVLNFPEFALFLQNCGYYHSREIPDSRLSNSQSTGSSVLTKKACSSSVGQSLSALFRLAHYLSHPKPRIVKVCSFGFDLTSRKAKHIITFSELPLAENIDSVSLESVVRLEECLCGYESFVDGKINKILEEAKLRKRAYQVYHKGTLDYCH